MRTLIIGLPKGFDSPYLLQEKIFEFIHKRDVKYVKDYEVLYLLDIPSSKHIEKFIRDWDLVSRPFISAKDNPTNRDRILTIKDMVKEGRHGDALVFFSAQDDDMGNKILLDQCTNEHDMYTKVCRLDFGNEIY